MSVLFISGSTRKNSYNTKLINVAYNYATKIGMQAKIIKLDDYELPIYNADLEEEHGIPENAKKLKKLFIESKGFFISSPEYNGFFPPLLKNMFDWASRPEDSDPAPLAAYTNKIAVISSTSVGKFGGMRGLPHLRLLLSNLGVNVLHSSVSIPFADKNLSEFGDIKDDNLKKFLFSSIDNLNNFINKN